jgi:hypothetical protein
MFSLFMIVLFGILVLVERFLAKRSGSVQTRKSSTPVRRVSSPRRR